MRIHRAMAAITLSAATTLGAATVPASAAAAVPSAAPRVVVLDCWDQPKVRPSDFILACGDGNNYFTGLRWGQWGSASVTATGRQMLNDCTPDCDRGKFHAYPVTITFDRVRPWAGHPGVVHYFRLRVYYPANKPADTPRQEYFDLWG